MTTLDIIRLAAERAEQTGDILRPEFHEMISKVAEWTPAMGNAADLQLSVANHANVTAKALRESAKAQLEFRTLLSTLNPQLSTK